MLTDPPAIFFPQFVLKKNQNDEKMIFKFWKFCNSMSCLHNMLSERTSDSDKEMQKMNQKAEYLN